MVELRAYQAEAVGEIEGSSSRRLIAVAPTGSGKTVIAAEIAKRAVDQHHYVLFLAHRREIITQTRDKLIANGLSPGIVQAGLEKELRPQANVQVCSVQTIWARAMRSKTMPLPPGTVLIVDEAHHSRANTYQKIIAAYPDAVLYGLTATPCRGDGRGLGNVFSTMIECPQVAELIVGGYLVKSRVYAPVDPDLKGVKTAQGDYIISQLAGRMNTDELVGDIVTHWHKYGENRPTVAFAVDVAHSVHIAREFNAAGVRAEHLDGETPQKDRDAILARLKSGETQVVSNCMVLTEGWDMPEVGCAILARPTRQMGLFRQMIARVLRPADGKPDAVILDHSGAVFRHGLPEDHVEWTLDVDRRAENPAQAKRKAGEAPKLRECPKCQVLITKPPCPGCGWVPAPRAGRDRDFLDGELGLVIGGKAQAPIYGENARMEFFQQLRAVQQMRGYKKGWAAHKFKDKFGTFPPWSYNDLPPIAPTNTVLSWVRSRSIAYAKAVRAA
jgi:DNA repair protein RadD